jgi:hypothetical protein
MENIEILQNLKIEENKWYSLGKTIDVLYKDSKNVVYLLDNNGKFVLLFIVLDPRLDLQIPMIAFDFREDAEEFFKLWKAFALKGILKAQKNKK